VPPPASRLNPRVRKHIHLRGQAADQLTELQEHLDVRQGGAWRRSAGAKFLRLYWESLSQTDQLDPARPNRPQRGGVRGGLSGIGEIRQQPSPCLPDHPRSVGGYDELGT
jgi:hypothetical protein